ncbi:hypothetical protein HUU59_11050 [bacterium]|nr:hypothetical protein [bacterium]
MTKRKKKDESEGKVLGACEYEAGGSECDRKAVVEVNGWALCGYHKKYGPTLDVRGQKSADSPENLDKIEQHNQGVTDRNNGVAAQAAFTPYSVYADLCELTDRVEKNMKRVPKGRQVAAYLNSARLLLLDEMSSVAGDVDPNQVQLPLGSAAADEPDPEVDGDDQ